MAYRIEFKKSAIKELQALPAQAKRKIFAKIDKLAENPFITGSKLLKGVFKNKRRIAVGNYRVIYEVFKKRLVIHIVRVRHRKDVYRK